MTSVVKGRPVVAHVFEYTTSFALDPDLQFKYPDKGIVPCQIIFCLKEKNASLPTPACVKRQSLIVSICSKRRSIRIGGSSTLLLLCYQ